MIPLRKAACEQPLLRHAAETKRLLTCEGPPGWTYKSAYDEAVAMLESAGA